MKIVAATDHTKRSAAAGLALKLWPEHTRSEMEADLKEHCQAGGVVFLAQEENSLIGFAQCGLRHDYVEGRTPARSAIWRASMWNLRFGGVAWRQSWCAPVKLGAGAGLLGIRERHRGGKCEEHPFSLKRRVSGSKSCGLFFEEAG